MPHGAGRWNLGRRALKSGEGLQVCPRLLAPSSLSPEQAGGGGEGAGHWGENPLAFVLFCLARGFAYVHKSDSAL